VAIRYLAPDRETQTVSRWGDLALFPRYRRRSSDVQDRGALAFLSL